MTLRYFNPGHEAAVLSGSPYYQAPARVVKMQQDLSFLPAWYASNDDYIYIEKPLTEAFLSLVATHFGHHPGLVRAGDAAGLSALPSCMAVDLWGLSPQAVHLFESLSREYDLHLRLPEWKTVYTELGSRATAMRCLSFLSAELEWVEPAIIPRRFDSIKAIEQQVISSGIRQVVKSPYSSSGRGLLWLNPVALTRSERQIITGMLNKQGFVSVEPALDKVLDFSMHFEADRSGVSFRGYSVFHTNEKGAYKFSVLDSQTNQEQALLHYVSGDCLKKIKEKLSCFLKEIYFPVYSGPIGVDMLIYRSGEGYLIHPCVEINMRRSMGSLALSLQERWVADGSRGRFVVDFSKDRGGALAAHSAFEAKHPLVYEKGQIVSGYLSLCPVDEDTNYYAYLFVD